MYSTLIHTSVLRGDGTFIMLSFDVSIHLPLLYILFTISVDLPVPHSAISLVSKVVYKNNDVRLELSKLALQGDHKMKVHGVVAFKCENVATLDPITFETPEAFITLHKWNAKKTGSISFDFRTTEPNGLLLFSHGRSKQQTKEAKSPVTLKVDFFAIEMLDGHLYLLLDMGSGTTKTRAVNKKVNDGEWYHVDFQRDGRSGRMLCFIQGFFFSSF